MPSPGTAFLAFQRSVVEEISKDGGLLDCAERPLQRDSRIPAMYDCQLVQLVLLVRQHLVELA